MAPTEPARARLESAVGLPELLSASFEAFEAIRVLARSCEDQAPELFAAFMTTADAAVDGREAITTAPSLPPATGGPAPPQDLAPAAARHEAIGALAELSAVLADRLGHGARLADAPGDRAACHHASLAAQRIHGLTAGGAP